MLVVPSSSFDKRIQLMTPHGGQDPATGDPLPPVVFLKAWASIRPISGSERYAAGQFVQKANTVITLRYQEGITSAMTVAYGDQSFVIEYIDDVNFSHVQLNLMCYLQESP